MPAPGTASPLIQATSELDSALHRGTTGGARSHRSGAIPASLNEGTTHTQA
jgi:hypothetical protein